MENLAHAMEMIETGNQNPTTLGVKYNNPGLFEILELATCLWLCTGDKRVREIPDLQLRQAGPAPAVAIGDDRQDDSLLPARDDDRQVYPFLCFQLTRNREGKLRSARV